MGQEQSSLTVNGEQQPPKTCRPCGDWGKKEYNTVKVDAAALNALGKENAAQPNIVKDAGGKANAISKEEQERSRQIQEWDAKHEMERRVKEEQERQQAEMRRREAERRRLQLEQEAKEREELEHQKRAEQLRLEEIERAREEEEWRLGEEHREQVRLQEIEDQKKVRAWLQANGFKGLNDLVRKKLSKIAPLQLAVQQNDVEMMRLLLASGADASKVNGKNESALTVAKKMDKKGSHAAVVQVLTSKFNTK